MREAYLVGAGQSPFGSFPDETYRSLFDTAYDRTLGSVDGEFDPARIDEAFLGTLGVGGRQIGLSAPVVTEHVGLYGMPSTVRSSPRRVSRRGARIVSGRERLVRTIL